MAVIENSMVPHFYQQGTVSIRSVFLMGDRFVSEKDVEEAKKRRQEEWDKVRDPSDPVEAPEEDMRSLYERLKEVRDRKQVEYEEEHKFKNMIRGLDSEECHFLSMVETVKEKEENRKKEEEDAVFNELEKARHRTVSCNKSPSVMQLRALSARAGGSRTTRQSEVLSKAVKRKCLEEIPDRSQERQEASDRCGVISCRPTALKLVGKLPGVVSYASTSSNSDSDDSDCSVGTPILPNILRASSLKDVYKGNRVQMR